MDNNTFTFPDFCWQPYPVYNIAESGKRYSLKSILYPSPKSWKKFTRKKKKKKRSLQAKIFDALINVGYFDPITPWIVREFPVIIRNDMRVPGEEFTSGFILIDYFFSNLKDDKGHYGVAVELDSDLHDEIKDQNRDKYLERIGVLVFRIRNFEKPSVQKTRFHELKSFLNTLEVAENPRVFTFGNN